MIGVCDDGQWFGFGRFRGGADLGLLDGDWNAGNGMVELLNGTASAGRRWEDAGWALLERWGRGGGLL